MPAGGGPPARRGVWPALPWLIALIAAGIVCILVPGAVRPRAIEHAVANLEGEVGGASAAL